VGANSVSTGITPGQTAGIVVGVLLALAVFLCAFIFFRLKSRQKHAAEEKKRKTDAKARAAKKAQEVAERLAAKRAAGTGLESPTLLTVNPLDAQQPASALPGTVADDADRADPADINNRSARNASVSSPVSASAVASALHAAFSSGHLPKIAHKSPPDGLTVAAIAPPEAVLLAATPKRRPSLKMKGSAGVVGRRGGGFRPMAPRRGDAPVLQFNPMRSKSTSKKGAAMDSPSSATPDAKGALLSETSSAPIAAPADPPPPESQSPPPPPQPPSALEQTVSALENKLVSMMRSLSQMVSPAAAPAPEPAPVPAPTPAAPLFPPPDWGSFRAGTAVGDIEKSMPEGTADAWVSKVSRTTGEQYYFNPIRKTHVHGWTEKVSRTSGARYFLNEATKQHALSLDDAHNMDNAEMVNAEEPNDAAAAAARPPLAGATIDEQRRALTQKQNALRAATQFNVDGPAGGGEQSSSSGIGEWLRKYTSRGHEMFVNFVTKEKTFARPPRGSKIFVQRDGEFVLDEDNDDDDDDNEDPEMMENPMHRNVSARLPQTPHVVGGGVSAGLSSRSLRGILADSGAGSFSARNPLHSRRSVTRRVDDEDEAVVDFHDADVHVHEDPRSYLERWDESKNAPFYFHILTGTTTWHPPRGSRVYHTEEDHSYTRVPDEDIAFEG
jgi:hypothetical protein